MRKSQTGVTIALIVICIFVAALLRNVYRGDALDRTLISLSGPTAVDCGRLRGDEGDKFEAKAEAMDACIDAAYDAGKPFRVRQDALLDNVSGSMGIVGTSDGKVHCYYYDPNKWYLFRPVKEEPFQIPQRSPRGPRYWLLY